jgi:hypothetical protein
MTARTSVENRAVLSQQVLQQRLRDAETPTAQMRNAQGGQQRRLVVSACTVCEVWSVCAVLLLATQAVVYGTVWE